MKKFEALTKYLPMKETTNSDEVNSFVYDIYAFIDKHPEYYLNKYQEILKENNIDWGMASMKNANISTLNETVILALLVAAVRADRFCEGIIHTFVQEGLFHKWLSRLKELDAE